MTARVAGARGQQAIKHARAGAGAVSDRSATRGKDLGQSPGNSVLAVSLGALIVVPAIVSMWRTSDRVERTQEVVGMERRASGPIIFILLLLVGPVGLWYTQNELNKAWRTQAEGGEAAALPPEQPVTQQPPGESRPAPVAPEAPDAQ
jgi:hypothetical protein